MLSITRSARLATSRSWRMRVVTPLSSFTRPFGKKKETTVEGRGRYEVLGDSASYAKRSWLTCRYPNFRTTCSLDAFREKWDHLQKGERAPENEVCVAGNGIEPRVDL